MIINCPNCQAKYDVPVSALSKKVKAFRCSNCRHVWTVRVEEGAVVPVGATVLPDFIPEEVGDFFKKVSSLEQPIPDKMAQQAVEVVENRPTIHVKSEPDENTAKKCPVLCVKEFFGRYAEKIHVEKIKKILPILAALLFSIGMTAYFYKDFKAVCLSFSRPQIVDLSFDTEKRNNTDVLHVRGWIRNPSSSSHEAVPMSFVVFNSMGQKVQQFRKPVTEPVWEGKTDYPFEMILDPLHPTASRVEIELETEQ